MKTGDRVRVRSGRVGGTVRGVWDGAGCPVWVLWDNGDRGWYREADLVLFAPEPVAPEPVVRAPQYDTAGWRLRVELTDPAGVAYTATHTISAADFDVAKAQRTMLRETFRELVSGIVHRWWDTAGRVNGTRDG